MADVAHGPPSYEPRDIATAKNLAAIGYVCVCCLPGFLVPMFGARDNPFAQFHARQGAALYVAAVGLAIAGFAVDALVTAVLGAQTTCVGTLLQGLTSAFALAMTVVGAVGALRGEAKPLPVVGLLAEKLPF